MTNGPYFSTGQTKIRHVYLSVGNSEILSAIVVVAGWIHSPVSEKVPHIFIKHSKNVYLAFLRIFVQQFPSISGWPKRLFLN